MIVGILALGLAVFVNNHKKPNSAQFLLIAVFFSAWFLVNLFSNDISLDYVVLLNINRLIFVFSAAAMGLTPILISETSGIRNRTKYDRLIINFTAFVMLISSLPFVVDSVILTEPIVEIEFGILGPVYFLFVLMMIIEIFIRYFEGIKKADLDSKARLKIMGVSILISVVLAFITNAVLPAAFGNYDYVLLGPLFFAVMLCGVGYAIVKERLFDVTGLVVKSMIILVVGCLTTLVYFYAILAAGSGYIQSFDQRLESLLYALLCLGMLLIGIPAYLIISRRVMPKLGVDNYALQKTVSEFIVDAADKKTPVEVLEVLKATIDSKLNPSFSRYIVLKNKSSIEMLGNKENDLKLSKGVVEFLSNSSDLVYDLQDDYSFLRKDYIELKNIEVIIKLQPNNRLCGLILIGRKNTGFMYTSKDFKLMDSIAWAAGLALENAVQLEEIKKFNKTLTAKVQRATKELESNNMELTKLNREKNLFIKSATHQIKPQITTAIGFSELLSKSVGGKLTEDEKSDLRYAISSMQRISHAVTGILDIAGHEKPTVSLSKSTQNIVALVKLEIDSISNTNDRDYRLTSSSETVLAKVDKYKLCDVIYNLLDNADKYSDAGQPVEVSVVEESDKVAIEVKDYGIGIKSKNTKKVLDVFFRGSRANEYSPNGTGVGLYVVKLFVEAHGGNVIVESVEGQGSTFTVTLPSGIK